MWLPVFVLLCITADALRASSATASQRIVGHSGLNVVAEDGAFLTQSPVTTTESVSWFSRLKNSLLTFVLGLVLIVCSIPVLWANESRLAQMESLLSIGRSQARSVDGKKADVQNQNWLVHVQGEMLVSAAPVADPRFDVSFDSDCLRLSSMVEIFQVVEHAKKVEREKFGGGKEVITTYTYTQEWSSAFKDSSSYHDVSQRINQKLPGLSPGSNTTNCSRVECGECFLLPSGLLVQCHDFTLAHERLPDSVCLNGSKAVFKLLDDHQYFYHSAAGSFSSGMPQVGDVRVQFKYVPNHTATVLALQVQAEAERDTFLPYRLIRRSWFGISEKDEKQALLTEGQKSPFELARDASSTGCCALLCCACNLVTMCFSSLLTAELYHLFPGSVDTTVCFSSVSRSTHATKWALRGVGWLMMFIGMYALFAPLLTFIRVIPFMGPLVASVGSLLIWLLCLISTAILASIIVIVAYSFYHPLMALIYSAVTASAVAGVVLLAAHM